MSSISYLGMNVVLAALHRVYFARALYAAALLGIPPVLENEGSMSGEELAARLDVNQEYLERMMRALIAQGFFIVEDGKYTMNKMAATLLADDDNSVVNWLLFIGSNWEAMSEPEDMIAEGKSGFELSIGKPIYEYFSQNPVLDHFFAEGMAKWTERKAFQIARSEDFSGYRRFVDIGAGQGDLIVRILKDNPDANAVLFDRSTPLHKAEEKINEEELSSRCIFVVGDFRKEGEIPKGGDAYLMKTIIRDWDDENALQILKNCHEAIGDAPLFIIDSIYDFDPSQEPVASFVDLELMFLFGGKIRTREQWDNLLHDAGFSIYGIRRIPETALNLIYVRRDSGQTPRSRKYDSPADRGKREALRDRKTRGHG